MSKSLALAFAFLLALPVAVLAQMERTPAPEGARLYFVTPTEGAEVSSPVTIRFGLSGMGVAPAGVEHPRTGHHHLLINIPLSEVDMNAAIPADERHIHFGGGETEARVELPPGTHRLQLLLGDHNHIPHDPPLVSEVITITVR